MKMEKGIDTNNVETGKTSKLSNLKGKIKNWLYNLIDTEIADFQQIKSPKNNEEGNGVCGRRDLGGARGGGMGGRFD